MAPYSVIVLFMTFIAFQGLTFGQHQQPVRPTERVGHPLSEPLPSHPMSLDPITMLQLLLSGDIKKRGIALHDLGVVPHEDITISDVRLDFINVEMSKPCEAVLVLTDDTRSTSVFVMYKTADQWWNIGSFHYWWHWEDTRAEHFLEFRDTVWPGTKDIIVRDMSGGTDLVLTELSIYRVYREKLYKVFENVETRAYSAGATSVSEESTISFFADDKTNIPSIKVERRRGTMDPRNRAPESRAVSCEVYGWNGTTFSFLRDVALTSRSCPTTPTVRRGAGK